MRIDRKIPDGVLPCSSNYQYGAQPYYVVAPAFMQQSAGIRVLHELCSLLNQLGYEAYVDSPVTSGKLWTPRLTQEVKVAHCRAGKTPVVVYPEVVKGTPMGLGLPVRYVLNFPGLIGGDKSYSPDQLVYTFHHSYYPDASRLYLPVINLANIDVGEHVALEQRTDIAYYHNRYTKAGGKLRDFGPDAIEISSTVPDSNEKTLAILKKAKLLYCYEASAILLEANLCGCAVVLIPNAITLKEIPESLSELGKEGVAWGESPQEIEWALQTVAQRRLRYLRDTAEWQAELSHFIADTQARANQLGKDKAWPQKALDGLPFFDLSAQELADRADRKKYHRVNEQYTLWVERCTLREIDADIYAEHLSSGRLPAVSVLIVHRNEHINALADTLDSLSHSLGQPASLTIASDVPAPAEMASENAIDWIYAQSDLSLTIQAHVRSKPAQWLLIVKSGTRIAPQGIAEWALSTQAWPLADLVYADDDVWAEDGSRVYPCFKPDPNVELLRSTNYLGTALLVKVATWLRAGAPLSSQSLYAYALQLMVARGRSALGHVDTVLSHGTGDLGPELENQEYLAARQVLLAACKAERLMPQARLGTWLVDYHQQDAQVGVSLLVPTGMQTGYLRSLIESLKLYPQPNLAEIVLVTEPGNVSEVEYALSDVLPDVAIVVVELHQDEYSHARALNAGIAKCRGDFVLVCDDDTEMIHAKWLGPLLGIAAQPDVGCVAPRLVAHRGLDARVVGGPMVLGIGGTAAPYGGEEGRLEEAGVYSRLQLSQDVSTVAGNCFLLRRQDWADLGGFNEVDFSLWFPVLDFCLRLGQVGKRHVWTPLSSVMHQGGKTLAALARDAQHRLRLAERELSEKNALLTHWAKQLANDPCYSRHLSLVTPYDVEPNIVIDWQPKRHDRPRLLAVPLTSGAGQYRVIEPLNALQDASLAQTCIVMAPRKGVTRILHPLELVRAAPDRLILQHSVDDGHLGMAQKYKLAMPDLEIVQMVDDLLGDVPAKHPNRNFQSREGHQRMIHALKQSDILVVTTEPLRSHYGKYVKDVRLVPNSLNTQWGGLRKDPTPREKLRVGWVGAAQHKGDLDLIADVVRQLVDEVDWVFMGMCTDEIKPFLKEFHGFVSIIDYPRKVSDLELDIAIAPLESNVFNECKSNLRLLEYGAMGWPVVCSDVYPYRADNPPVMRCGDQVDEWVSALRKLIADPVLRTSMGAQLHEWVDARYMLSGLVPVWRCALLE